jgi:hypothetical protein
MMIVNDESGRMRQEVIMIYFSPMALPVHSGPWPLIQFRNHLFPPAGLLGRVISPS